MSEATDHLREEVTTLGDVVDSTVALIGGLVQRLRDALEGDDIEADVEALADELSAHTDELAAAVAANTPVDPGPPPMPDLPATDSRPAGEVNPPPPPPTPEPADDFEPMGESDEPDDTPDEPEDDEDDELA